MCSGGGFPHRRRWSPPLWLLLAAKETEVEDENGDLGFWGVAARDFVSPKTMLRRRLRRIARIERAQFGPGGR
jgi:hypothetical protein